MPTTAHSQDTESLLVVSFPFLPFLCEIKRSERVQGVWVALGLTTRANALSAERTGAFSDYPLDRTDRTAMIALDRHTTAEQ